MIRAHRNDIIICLLLASATFLVYWEISGHQFINVDDNIYVTNSPYVQSGLTRESIRWAFTTTTAEFWHPLTWLSYMLDTELFGVNPGGYLFTNLLLHVINSLLLFLLLKWMTGALWQSAFVAALFALHPLHVESVAWVAERKDVLSALFWILSIGCYAYYVKRPGYKRYLAVCLLFALGLMVKSMLVTMPFVLLLMDVWPLARLQPSSTLRSSVYSFFRLVREKIPLFALSAAAGAITLFAQKSGGGLGDLNSYPLIERIANAFVSYGVYIGKMFWPQNLAVFYPYPENLSGWQVAGSLFALVVISALAIRWSRRYPFFLTGWLWYLGTLLPVIGLIKIGDFAMADRYTYIPLIGLFIVIAWGLPEIISKLPYKKLVLSVAAVLALTGLATSTLSQVRYWSNSVTLFEHALQITENNFFAHFGMGHALANQGKFNQAIGHFSAAVRIKPEKATLHSDLGRALASQNKLKEARHRFSIALNIKPDKADTHYYLGNVLVIQSNLKPAIFHFAEALRLAPIFKKKQGADQRAQNHIVNGEMTFSKKEQFLDASITQYEKAIALQPDRLRIVRNLALAYAEKEEYEKALSLLKIGNSNEGIKRAFVEGFEGWDRLKIE